jgi:hypothetical protein
MRKILLDIECFPNLFLLGFKDYKTKEGQIFEISKQQNDLEKIVDWCKKFEGFVITFNGIHYDQPVLSYICYHSTELENYPAEQIADKIHDFSSYIINNDFIDNKYKYYFKNWIPVDVYLHWSRMLRLSKKISLKSLGIQINYPVIQELPYPPGSYLNKKQIEEVRNYNYIHDLGILDKLLTHPIYLQGKPTTIEKEIALRRDIKKEYETSPYIYSWDAPKIASELLLSFKAKKENKKLWILKKELKDLSEEDYIALPLQNPNFKLLVFQNLFKRFEKVNQNNDRGFSEEVILIHGDTRLKISYGLGGIHNIMKNEIYKSTDNHIVKTSDVSSLYPNLIINYNCVKDKTLLNLYSSIKIERIIAKREGNKNKDAVLKLILNSFKKVC